MIAVFRWSGFAHDGESRGGWEFGRSPDGVRRRLRSRGIVASTIETWALGRIRPVRSARADELASATRYLATLMDAGVPLLSAWRMTAGLQRRGQLREVLEGMASEIESGATVADAIRRRETGFGPAYAEMVAAGERSGRLPEALRQLAGDLERRARVRGQLLRAGLYPATILTVGAGAALFLLLFVVPAFEESFAAFGAELPLPTRMVVTVSHSLGLLLLPGMVGLASGIAWLRRLNGSPVGRKRIHRVLLRMPFVGGLLRSAAAGRVAGVLGMMVQSGVPMVEALRTAARLSGNRVTEDSLLQAARAVERGDSLGAALRSVEGLPHAVGELVAVGEQSGSLDSLLIRAAQQFEADLDRGLTSLTGALEPAAVVFLGVLLGGLVVAMYLPVFQLGAAL